MGVRSIRDVDDEPQCSIWGRIKSEGPVLNFHTFTREEFMFTFTTKFYLA